ncbi:MAG: hypothetical protein HYR85_25780 [Planctomycetes bacterium]|nr:hypothetical protein [Planctomycetota bacterium]MBI3847708.1 hypothetical protein [Planctomycetota bacterium]
MNRATGLKTIVAAGSFAMLLGVVPAVAQSSDTPKPGQSTGGDGGEDLHPEGLGRRPGRGPDGGRPGNRDDWKPHPAKLSDWKITATKTDTTEEKNGQKTFRYTDKVRAEMAGPGGMKLVVEAPKLVIVANGDIPVRMEATGGIKASSPPRPGTFEADDISMSFDALGWPSKVSVPKELRVSLDFGPLSVTGKAVALNVEFKDREPVKGSVREVSVKMSGAAGTWSGGSARVKEIRGNKETDEIDFEGIELQGDHVSGGFAAKADHGRVRSRRFRLFGNVLFSLGDESFNADVVEVGEGEPIIESKDDKQILERILKTVGIRR